MNSEKQSHELIFSQKKQDALEVDLSIEKNWRQELQAELKTQLEINEVSKEQIVELKEFKIENEKYGLFFAFIRF